MLNRLLVAYLIGTGFLFAMAYTIESHNGAFPDNPAWVLISTLRAIFVGIGILLVCAWLYNVWLEHEEACGQKAEELKRKQEAEIEKKKTLIKENDSLWRRLDKEKANNRELSCTIASLKKELELIQKQLEENAKADLIAESATATQEEALSQFI